MIGGSNRSSVTTLNRDMRVSSIQQWPIASTSVQRQRARIRHGTSRRQIAPQHTLIPDEPRLRTGESGRGSAVNRYRVEQGPGGLTTIAPSSESVSVCAMFCSICLRKL